jgi:hypothetical protein
MVFFDPKIIMTPKKVYRATLFSGVVFLTHWLGVDTLLAY